mmetsp:Transcript_37266/g.97712  ORF Transcript_37266/g.97712 Transcript_37266/m.97712 type:complete len:214 (+) Transcript_37266:567-1208(+)
MSSDHGVLVAASVSSCSPSFGVTPDICTRNSVLIRRDDSDSPEPLAPHIESTSSTNRMVGAFSRAIVNIIFTSLSLCPCHLDTRSEDDTAMKVDSLALLAMALAMYDLPVPGGPNRRMPFHASRFPLKKWGYLIGRITASSSAALASVSPATSSHLTDGFSTLTMSSKARRSSDSSALSPPPSGAAFFSFFAASALRFFSSARNCFSSSARVR